jgi:adenylosuccinate synthase
LLPNVTCVLPAGSYIDLDILEEEISRLDLSPDRLVIDPNAVIISEDHKRAEAMAKLTERIGSTGSGTGAAIVHRIQRQDDLPTAGKEKRLQSFIQNAAEVMRIGLNKNERIIIEGTQGFGLSVLHSPYYPKATSRDTTAAAFVSEAGLSPIDVDQVVMVIRAFPIRVCGDSGPLPEEIDWQIVAEEGGHSEDLSEFTSATKKLRRVGRFDPDIVQRAISINSPNMIVLNHIDYIASETVDENGMIQNRYVSFVEEQIGHSIDWVGTGPSILTERSSRFQVVAGV